MATGTLTAVYDQISAGDVAILEKQAEQIKEAEGEAKRFLSVYNAYKTGKEVTVKRLYLERMEKVLRDSDKVIIDKGQGGPGVVPYLPLPEIRRRSAAGRNAGSQ